MKKKKSVLIVLSLLVSFALIVSGCGKNKNELSTESESAEVGSGYSLDESSASKLAKLRMNKDYDWKSTITDFGLYPYAEVNNNIPFFSIDDLTTESYESYSDLDELGRCGAAMACLGYDLMPTGEREDISEIHPSGWAQEKYDFIDKEWLYNRCHLIAYSLTGENANEKNLITGTRYMNTEGMWPVEQTVVYYLYDHPENHVMYRVTPIFDGDNLLCSGVLMEAFSVEDEGEGVCFCVYCYNVQPDVSIDYATGESFSDVDVSEAATE